MARLTSSIILFAFFYSVLFGKLHQVIFRDVVIFSCNAHGVCVFVCRTVQIGGECHVVGWGDVPCAVSFHQEREILDVVIHIAAHDIEYRPTVEFDCSLCRDVQFSADFKQILIARCIRIHGSKCLCMYLLSVYPIVTLRQEVMFSLNLNESGRHHRNPFLCHLIIYHFHLRERKIVPFCKLQYVVGIALR